MTAYAAGAARALVVVTAVALAADALLGLLTGAVSSVAGGPAAPWWVTGHVVERGRWVVFALLLAGSARPIVAGDAGEGAARTDAAWRAVGRAAMVVPLLWIAALWIVQAGIFTAADRWDIDGQVFVSADYYRRLLAGYAPWLLAGAAARVLSRHAG